MSSSSSSFQPLPSAFCDAASKEEEEEQAEAEGGNRPRPMRGRPKFWAEKVFPLMLAILFLFLPTYSIISTMLLIIMVHNF